MVSLCLIDLDDILEVDLTNIKSISNILPTHEIIKDFCSSSTFTLLLSNSGKLWRAENFLQTSLNALNYHSMILPFTIISIVCNETCALLLSNTGRIYGLGYSNSGILCPSASSSTPTIIPYFNMKQIKQVCMSSTFACCIDIQGSVYTWGTFTYANFEKRMIQLTNYKKYSVKEVCCNENYIAICTDGGFVYYFGNIGSNANGNTLNINHCKVAKKNTFPTIHKIYNSQPISLFEMISFRELESLHAIQISAGKKYLSILTETYEVYIFDSHHVINQLPTSEKVLKIITIKNALFGLNKTSYHKWVLSSKSQNKPRKSHKLTDFQGKVISFNNDIDIITIKKLATSYTIVANYNTCEAISYKEIKDFSQGWNQILYEKDLKNYTGKALVLGQYLINLVNNAKKKYFQIIKGKWEQRWIMGRMVKVAKFFYNVERVYSRWKLRIMIESLQVFKENIGIIQRLEKLKNIQREKFTEQAIVKMLNSISLIIYRSLRIDRKKAFKSLQNLKRSYTSKLTSLKCFFSIFTICCLKKFFNIWRKISIDILKGLIKLDNFSIELKKHHISKTFHILSFFSAYKRYDNNTKIITLCQIMKKISNKYSKCAFKKWKNNYLKLNALRERNNKNFKICVKLGCKNLFPVLYKSFSKHWIMLHHQAMNSPKSRYKHISLFIVYFIKKKLQFLKEILFVRPRYNTSHLQIENPEDFNKSDMFSRRDDSPSINLSTLSSYNIIKRIHRRVLTLNLSSPTNPKDIMRLTPTNKSLLSSSQSTIRPPWKPASRCSSKTATPQRKNKYGFETQQNKCNCNSKLFSKMTMPIKRKLIKNKTLEYKLRLVVG
ncbi:hypothetical protein SteCoe_33391 [Stentor coeruleus]|uniref:Uncharacterized protein n=1 Tax=Stentor coeruleus TaxID=5963 RepID=A0A1R2AWZ6_9CILI|nr:hypothetical protein SteCoe_33391 [Stentor coeruleus]